jgi:RNA ligase
LTNISNRDIWLYLKENKPFDDIIDRVPDEFYEWIRKTADNMVEQFGNIEKKCLIDFANIRKNCNIDDRKCFALEAIKCDHPSVLFSMLDKKYYGDIIWKIIYPTYSKPFKNDES